MTGRRLEGSRRREFQPQHDVPFPLEGRTTLVRLPYHEDIDRPGQPPDRAMNVEVTTPSVQWPEPGKNSSLPCRVGPVRPASAAGSAIAGAHDVNEVQLVANLDPIHDLRPGLEDISGR